MLDFVIDLIADVADIFIDLWANKILGKFKRK